MGAWDRCCVGGTVNGRIQKFTAEGVFVSEWGWQGASPGEQWRGEGTGDGEFSFPMGVAVAPDGSVYVADSYNHRIQKFTSEGVFISKRGTERSGDGGFDYPIGVAVASDGSVYVADHYNSLIQKFTYGGVFVSKWNT